MSCCCNDIFTCHAELVHAEGEIQFVPWVNVTVPANSNIQQVDFTGYFELGDVVDVVDVDANGNILSVLGTGLTVTGYTNDTIQFDSPVDTTGVVGTAKVICRPIEDGQSAIDRLYRRKKISESNHRAEVSFFAYHWRGLDYLKVIATGVPGNNEIGPHGLANGAYLVNFYQDLPGGVSRVIKMAYLIDRTTGAITFWKTGGVKAFSGRVEIVYAAS